MTCLVRFKVDRLHMELSAFSKVAHRFLTDAGRNALANALEQVRRMQAEPRGGTWEVPHGAPIQTVPSSGEYEVDGSGTTLFAEISFVVDYTRVSVKRKPTNPAEIDWSGRASISISLFPVLPAGSSSLKRALGVWHFDVGLAGGPGCHIHTQIPWRGLDLIDCDIPIPRLPSVLVSPIDAMDFVLGELFQVAWRKELTSRQPESLTWMGGQRRRLQTVLDFHAKAVSASLPLNGLRTARPASAAPLEMC